MTETTRRRIWYSPEQRIWWMEPADPLESVKILQRFEDAISVTNAYDVLPREFVNRLLSGAIVSEGVS